MREGGQPERCTGRQPRSARLPHVELQRRWASEFAAENACAGRTSAGGSLARRNPQGTGLQRHPTRCLQWMEPYMGGSATEARIGVPGMAQN
jgi:hypothetical protein